jgi:hypothetical protein
MSSYLKALCEKNLLLYREYAGGPAVVATGLYPSSSHLVLMSMLQSGDVSLYLQMPPATHAIEGADAFCDTLNERLVSGACVTYADTTRQFFIHTVVGSEHFHGSVTKFALDCDVVVPLCRAVGETGRWHPAVFALAQALPAEMHTFVH